MAEWHYGLLDQLRGFRPKPFTLNPDGRRALRTPRPIERIQT